MHNLTTGSDAIQWDALRFLVAEASYGGRVTDAMDQRILNVYINQYFHERVISESGYKLAADPRYCIPEDGELDSYLSFIKDMDSDDPPIAFGQHSNADISSQAVRSIQMLDSLLSLSPQVTSPTMTSSTTPGSGDPVQTPEQRVFSIASELLENRIPNLINRDIAEEAEQTALQTVLLQEITRYNRLLSIIRSSLRDLLRSLRGEVVMSADLEQVFEALLEGKVPLSWQSAYPSLKPLASWTRDLVARVDQLDTWSKGDPPVVFWISGFTFPSGFLTALKQTAARAQNVAVDELSFEFTVMREYTYHQRPKEGAYISGLFLEGSGWDRDNACLSDPRPMELVTRMPVIHLRPIINKRKAPKDVYHCPLYMYPVRAGESSCIISVDLKMGPGITVSHCVKLGTALLCSTSD